MQVASEDILVCSDGGVNQCSLLIVQNFAMIVEIADFQQLVFNGGSS